MPSSLNNNNNNNKDSGPRMPNHFKRNQGSRELSQPKSSEAASKPHGSSPKTIAGKISSDLASREPPVLSSPYLREGRISPDDKPPAARTDIDQEQLEFLKGVEASYNDLAHSKTGNKRSQTPPDKPTLLSPPPPKWTSSEPELPSLPPLKGTIEDLNLPDASDRSETEHDPKYPSAKVPPLFCCRDAKATATPQPGRHDFHEHFVHSFFSNAETEVNVHMGRDILDFVERELDLSDSLLDLVVLTGDEAWPWATTCGDYISKAWPDSSRQLHSLVRRLQRLSPRPITSPERFTDSKGDDEICIGPALGEKSCITSEGLKFLFKSRPKKLSDVLEALAWLLGVLQTSSDETIQISKVRMEDISTLSTTSFRFLTSMKSLPASSSSCWTPLVPKAVTAEDFPVPRRKAAMKGLEISFDLLCYLCGLEYEATEDGGVVLYGERSIVYPVRQVGDSVQWHFEAREPLAAGSLAMDLPGARLQVDDIEELREAKRHFLGLWADPRITLGTSVSDCSSITWSRLEEVLEERTRDGIMVGGTLVGPKVLNITLSKTYKIARTRKSTYMANFEAKMHSLIEAPVILYCPSERRAWMVPFTSVILHLARGRAQYQRALGMEITACPVAADGGQAAFEAIQRYCDNPFRGGPLEANEERKRAAIEGHINEVWIALDCATRATYKIKRYFRTQIVGYEMADIARVRSMFRMKRHNLETFATGWTPLLDEVHLTLFYEGLPDPIVPLVDENANSHCASSLWRELPHGHDLLAASLPCLRHVSEHLNSDGIIEQITRERWWHCPGRRHVFSMCKNTSSHICNRLQELKTNDWRSRDGIREPNQEDLLRYPHGIVCFRYRDSMDTIERSLNPSYIHAVEVGQPSGNSQLVPTRHGTNRRHSHSPDSGYSSGERPSGSSEQEPPSAGPGPAQGRINDANVQRRPGRNTEEEPRPQAENLSPPRQDTSPLPHRPGPVPQGRPNGGRPARRRSRRRRTSQPQFCVIL